MQVYKLTESERLAVENLASPHNVILVVCDYDGDTGCTVDYNALISDEYAEYLAILSPLDDARILDVEPPL